MSTITLNVQGMSCNHCVNSVEGALGKLVGVSSAKVDLSANQVTVSFDDTVVSVDQLKETIEDQGYDVV
ncbi:copper chaperone CopZ [Effusibacillus dendaii]|uniref:Copper chaperone CopZ n=1 Tax=Effusibacillus dendaii TaxID=2743772 RepID=A0A7I8DDS3_9BACL|nr:copper chaperone CopZ [Effusibacillus dendaii]BCJ88363.1 copper chaperone CopZ [Effusibacillus dendaii]